MQLLIIHEFLCLEITTLNCSMFYCQVEDVSKCTHSITIQVCSRLTGDSPLGNIPAQSLPRSETNVDRHLKCNFLVRLLLKTEYTQRIRHQTMQGEYFSMNKL
jgi:hypothetical protein